ncbi:MAG: tetratricopeptide repeat protein [Candidatus Eisenbacteria bacterium]|uniref:non-specific serine/threonine protein kinase n=1 Tax=Eiseniibacteriota bacterium TaxID=2212470 RepID=A0A538T9B2_UNCEI|nr:MAG: tetratricopeptide repeat protein [Candidatus Eisenbacteria bacterium]
MEPRPPHVSHYKIESTLGQGGMGVVYLATDDLLQRRAALKFLPPELSQDPEARRRFLNEGRAAATLSHPNAAVLFEVGTEGNEMFLAMEYVPGATLRELVASGPLSWNEVLEMSLQILGALREAHAKGIVHRDIKGANIKRTPEGRIKVMDFGLAKIIGGSTMTRSDAILGTASYMSPQQIVGQEVDGRSDLFSLGVVMYELLTGRLPFVGDQSVAVAHAILHEDPITIRELMPEVPADLEHIVFKAMMKNPRERYQSAEEMAEDLARFREHDRRRRAGVHEELDLVATREVVSARRERFLAPMVGRERPMERLKALHQEVRVGEGAAVCVAGEAGIGKSRLVDEFCRHCRREGTRVLVASSLFGGSASSYQLFAEAIKQYFALRGVDSAQSLQRFLFDRAPRIAGSIPVLSRFLRFAFATNGPTSEEELWEVLDQVICFISEERPLVLVLEDLQWADEGSVRLFHFLTRRASGRRMFLLGTYRPEEAISESDGRQHPLQTMLRMLGREDRFERIELARLSREEVMEVLARLYPGNDWGEEFGSLLYREAEGNPFFMVEILKLLTAEKILAKRDGTWTLATTADKISIPEKVYDVVMRRLSRLGPREREILELGAVEGDIFHSGTILRGLGLERMPLLKTLQFLEQIHHLIHAAGPQYHFDHSKIREILYDSIPPELRIEYHTVVGQFLAESFGASEEHAGVIAHNLLAAGLKSEALPYLMLSASAAARLFAHADAIRYLERAESLLHDLHPHHPPVERVRELAEVRQRRGDQEYAAGRYRAALVSYEAALELTRSAPDARREADIVRAIGRMQYLLGHPAESQRTYEEAIGRYASLAEEARAAGDDARLNSAVRELGKLYFFKGDMEVAEQHMREAIALAEKRGDERIHAAALNNLSGIHYVRGDLEEALACHRTCLDIRERLHDEPGLAQSHKNLGIIHYQLGEPQEAEDHLNEGLALYRKAVDRRGEAVTLRHLGNLHHQSGDHVGAQRHWEASLSLCRELGNTEDLCACLNNLGVLHFEQGHYASAERSYREGLEIRASLRQKNRSVAILHDNLAELYIDLHQLDRAEVEIRLSEQIASDLDAATLLAALFAKRALIASERGDLDTARDHARQAISLGEPTGHVASLVTALLASAEVELRAGSHAEAKRSARQARDIARWSKMAHLELHATLMAARAGCRAGTGSDSLEELAEVVRRANERGYRPLAARGSDLIGEICAKSGDLAAAATEFTRAADQMKEILASLSDEDRRSLVHHPDWKEMIGNLLDTLVRTGRRDDALGYLVAFGVASCDVEPAREGTLAAVETGA